MRVILVDDEKLALEQLAYTLENHEDVDVIGTYTDPLAALEKIQALKPDAVMLDISMPQMNGFQTAREILDISPNILILFITAYDRYALKAFELEAIDYILKPFSSKRIAKAVQLIRKRLSTNEKKDQGMAAFLQNQISTQYRLRIPVWKNEAIILIDTQDIYFCAVTDKKTYIYTRENKYFSEAKLVQLEERLGYQQFYRCHKSFIVNLQQIDKILPMFNQTYIIKMKGMNIEIPVSRHYAGQLKEMFGF